MKLGIDVLLDDPKLRGRLQGKRLGLLAHPASMTGRFEHAIDALAARKDLRLAAAFGPQHGLRGDKQDNMVESDDFVDPVHKIPIYSLYGKVRRPTEAMQSGFDVWLVDIQDVGCRIYTFLTTLLYILESAARNRKAVWVLDRPNPAGRPVEGMALEPGWESFVGAAPRIPMRHGLTLGEAARWFKRELKLDVELEVVKMEGYDPSRAPGYGWPLGELPWVNPSPNAASLSMARAYAGTVMVEGATISEGRGTTRPLETMGAPDLDVPRILAHMRATAPQWLQGCRIRPCFFEPTFHKHQKQLCSGLQLHLDDPAYGHDAFKPYRLVALFFKSILKIHPGYALWRDFAYEYETTRLAIDLINGGPRLRKWVEDANAAPEDFEAMCAPEERAWRESVRELLQY